MKHPKWPLEPRSFKTLPIITIIALLAAGVLWLMSSPRPKDAEQPRKNRNAPQVVAQLVATNARVLTPSTGTTASKSSRGDLRKWLQDFQAVAGLPAND